MSEQISPQPPNPEQPQSRSCGFAEAIQYFPEKEQSEARYYLSLRERQGKLQGEYSLQAGRLIKDYFFSLDYEAQENFRKSNIFHLFFGSGKPREDWAKAPLHTSDGAFEDFIENTFVPTLEEFEASAAKE